MRFEPFSQALTYNQVQFIRASKPQIKLRVDAMISSKDVEHISWLASIKINDDEKEQFVEQFNSILEYFHQLDEVDTDGVEPTYRVVDLANVFREDAASKSMTQEEALKNAPKRENGYFKSPRIV
jgi:aspartyl-tRNA(Asn)/glutamyl-tRNA(Gln) amidotransferase subunit C